MRSKVLRAIFPDRQATNLGKQVHPFTKNISSDAFANLAQAFPQVAPPAPGNLSNIGASLQSIGSPLAGGGTDLFDRVSNNLDRLRAVTENQVTQTQANTAALSVNTATKAVNQAVSAVSKATGGLLGGLTALPLVSGLLSLFGGSNNAQKQVPLTKYAAPPALFFDQADRIGNGGDTQQASYDRFGNSRTGSPAVPTVPDYAALVAMTRGNIADQVSGPPGTLSTNAPIANSGTQSSAATQATNVTVTVHAMDSRSFLDHSHDIAQAVREAMLNMHSINDVVNDL